MSLDCPAVQGETGTPAGEIEKHRGSAPHKIGNLVKLCRALR